MRDNLENDYDLKGRRVHSPAAPFYPVDIVRLQDLTGYAAPAAAKYIVQQPHASLPNAQALSSLATGLVKNTTTTGVLSIATAGVDYTGIITLTAGAGLTGGGTTAANRTFDVVAANTTITVNADSIQVGILPNKFIVQGTSDATLSAAQFLGALATGLVKNTTTTGVLSIAVINTDFPAVDARYVVYNATNAPPNAQNLGALGSGLLKHTVSAGTSTISVATGGTDFEFPLTFSQGLTRSVNAVTGDYITGKPGSQIWTGGTGSGDALTFRSTSHGTKGTFSFDSAATLDGAGKTLVVGSVVYNATEGGTMQAIASPGGRSAVYTDNTNSTGAFSHPSSGVVAIFGTLFSALHLGANGTTNRVQIATSGAVTITDLSGGSTALVTASSTGLLSRLATTTFAPADPQFLTLATDATLTNERVFVTSTGLAATDGGANGNYTITNNVFTGQTGSPTWQGSSNSNNLTIKANTSGSGSLTLTATDFVLSNSQVVHTTPTLTFDDASASGQIAVHFKTNGTLRGGLRADFVGTMIWFSGAAGHEWYTGGDNGTGTRRMSLSNAGAVQIDNLGGGTSTLVSTSTSGLLSRATPGTDFVVPGTVAPIDATYITVTSNSTLTNERTLNISTGLSFTDGGANSSYTITNDVVTGLATGSPHTWTASTVSGGALKIRSSSNGTKGTFTLEASQFLLSNGEVTHTVPTLVLDNTNASAQMGIHFKAAGTMKAALRGDFAGNMNYISNGASHVWYTGGDSGTGTIRLSLSAAGTVTVADLGGATDTLVKTSTVGLLSRATAGTDYTGIITLTAGAGLTGGGTTAANRTFDVVAANTTITVNADSIQVGTLPNSFIVKGTSDATLSGAQFLGALATGIVKNTTTTGVLSIASAGTDYQVPLTFSDGVTRTSNNVANDVYTGGSGSPIWQGSSSGNNLTIKANTSSTGNMTLTATAILISNAQTTFSNPTLTLDNTSASGQMGIYFKANGTFRGAVRADFVGNLNFAVNGGNHTFYTGGDGGTVRLAVGAGNVDVSSSYVSINIASPASTAYLHAGPTGSRVGTIFEVAGVTVADNSDREYFRIAPLSTAITSAVTAGGHHAFVEISTPNLTTASGSPVISIASTLYIQSEPLKTGALTITNPYAIFVDHGRSRFDGDSSNYVFEVPDLGSLPAGTINEPDKYLQVWVTGVGRRFIEMFSVT